LDVVGSAHLNLVGGVAAVDPKVTTIDAGARVVRRGTARHQLGSIRRAQVQTRRYTANGRTH
jgi:hypothetical protein